MDKSKEMRLFLAIALPQQLKEKLMAVKEGLNADGIKPVEDKNLHVTLKFLGEVKFEKLAGLEKLLREIKFPKFMIKLHGVGVFPNSSYVRVVWVGCESEELKKLGRSINEVLGSMFPKEEFTPHLTIARVRRKVDLREFLEKHKDEDFGGFECASFVLKSSILSKEGPDYETVAEFEANE